MSNWINEPLSLSGDHATLISLTPGHFPFLSELALDQRIWAHYVFDGANPKVFANHLLTAVQEREKGNHHPFVIYHRVEHKIIGSTRFMDMQRKHMKLEIGTTWLHPDYWGSVINLECKLLLLTYAFESMQCVRVQFKTDENNVRSRKAIEKIGGVFEGILRNEMLRDNGTNRHSAYYSIIDQEWAGAKARLVRTISDFKART